LEKLKGGLEQRTACRIVLNVFPPLKIIFWVVIPTSRRDIVPPLAVGAESLNKEEQAMRF
jgi:hypothetical protein